jgi:hypothetical protein
MQEALERLPCNHGQPHHVIESEGGDAIALQCSLCHEARALLPCKECGKKSIYPKTHCRVGCEVADCRNFTIRPRTKCRVHDPGLGRCARCKDEFPRTGPRHFFCSKTCKTLERRTREAARADM